MEIPLVPYLVRHNLVESADNLGVLPPTRSFDLCS